MASRVVITCDVHPDDTASRWRLNAGDGEREIDLCVACQSELLIADLGELLKLKGQPVEPAEQRRTAPSHKRGSHTCPLCQVVIQGTRQNLIAHLQSRKMHGMTRIEASHAYPPDGPAHDCEVCGLRTLDTPQAIRAHMTGAHKDVT